MAESQQIEFDDWLKDTLVKLDTDDEIFGPYIKGILDTDDPITERTEALQGILATITESNIEQLCEEIISKWSLSIESNKTAEPPPKQERTGLDQRLAQLMGAQVASLPVRKHTKKRGGGGNSDGTKEEKQLKEAILATYSQVSGDEDEDEGKQKGATAGGGGSGGGGGSSKGGLMKNTNAAVVEQEQKQKREESKEQSKQKKEKDKEEREKQKAKVIERKDREKKRTQKGERRR